MRKGRVRYSKGDTSRKSARTRPICGSHLMDRQRDNATMQEQKARQILQALIQGVDPFSGEELAAGTVLHQADVLRAMLAGVAALEQGAARSARRAQLPMNVGRPWTQMEELALINAAQGKHLPEDIAKQHGRTLRAIEVRLEKLGLITAEERLTRNRFVGHNGI